jgi:hypothetical protein
MRGFNLPYSGVSIRGVNIPWMKIDPGVKIPYDTGWKCVKDVFLVCSGEMLIY